jgi:hypothetical protein
MPKSANANPNATTAPNEKNNKKKDMERSSPINANPAKMPQKTTSNS